MTENGCGHCPGSVHVSENDIKEQMKKVMDSGVPIANEATYETRIKECNECNQLVYGTTCMSCGCFVKVRALNALRICPHSSGSKW